MSAARRDGGAEAADHATARRCASYDDLEELDLHSTIVFDAQGRVRWKRTGGDPFMDVDFLAKQLESASKSAAPGAP